MSDVALRDILKEDLPAIKSLILQAFGKGWNLERYIHNEELLSALLGIYASIFLEPSTFGKVAVKGGEVVGVILCSVNGEATVFRQLQTDTAPNALALLTATESDRMDIIEHMSVSFQTIGRLLENRIDSCDGGLELIAVSKLAQGLKIGKMLWDEACAYYNSMSAKQIYLIADSACNVGFYNHNGFSRTATEQAVYNYTTGQRRSQVFVYEYRF